ncbi:hypothetical protein ACLK19_02445 [Escherichia coli]
MRWLTYANVVIQRRAGELIAQRRQQLFFIAIHVCERKPDWRLNPQRLLPSSMQKSISLVVRCGMAWDAAGECHAEVFRQTRLLPGADVSVLTMRSRSVALRVP